MLAEKHHYQQTIYSPLPPQHYQQTPNPSYAPQAEHLLPPNPSLAQIERLKRYNAILGYTLNLFSVGLTLVMEAIMVYVLYKFYTTRDIAVPEAGRTSPWAKDTQLWPAFMLLGGSLVTFFLDLGGMIAACCNCRGSSKHAQKLESGLGYVGYAFYVVKWIAVATLYLVGRTSKDLWGWSCDVRAQKIQEFYVTELDFAKLCMEQVSWFFVASCRRGLC